MSTTSLPNLILCLEYSLDLYRKDIYLELTTHPLYNISIIENNEKYINLHRLYYLYLHFTILTYKRVELEREEEIVKFIDNYMNKYNYYFSMLVENNIIEREIVMEVKIEILKLVCILNIEKFSIQIVEKLLSIDYIINEENDIEYIKKLKLILSKEIKIIKLAYADKNTYNKILNDLFKNRDKRIKGLLIYFLDQIKDLFDLHSIMKLASLNYEQEEIDIKSMNDTYGNFEINSLNSAQQSPETQELSQSLVHPKKSDKSHLNKNNKAEEVKELQVKSTNSNKIDESESDVEESHSESDAEKSHSNKSKQFKKKDFMPASTKRFDKDKSTTFDESEEESDKITTRSRFSKRHISNVSNNYTSTRRAKKKVSYQDVDSDIEVFAKESDDESNNESVNSDSEILESHAFKEEKVSGSSPLDNIAHGSAKKLKASQTKLKRDEALLNSPQVHKVDRKLDKHHPQAKSLVFSDNDEDSDEDNASLKKRGIALPSSDDEIKPLPKLKKVTPPAKKPTGTRVRVPWSDKDTELFIDAMHKYGREWAVIKENTQFEIERTNINLKDRCRTLLDQGMTHTQLFGK